jgi:predicted nucleic acid-binding protein
MADMDTISAATAKRYNLILATADADMKNLDYLKSIAIARENWINGNGT